MFKKSKRYARKVMDYIREHTRHIGLIGMSVLIAAVSTLFCLSINVVSISDGTNTHTLYTLRSDVRGILGYAGYNSDYSIVGTKTNGNKLSIEVAATFPVYITYGENTITHITSISTVDDILISVGVDLKDDDIVSLPLNKVVDCETYIDIVPAPKKEETKPNKVQAVNTNTNVSVSKPVSTSNTISTLKPDIDIILDDKGIPVNYKKSTRVQATAYTYTGNRCSTGVNPQPGYIAVNPKVIPYGTKMYIVSADGKYVYGYAIAADTGGFAKSRPTNVDLFMETRAACKNFGRRDVIIYFL